MSATLGGGGGGGGGVCVGGGGIKVIHCAKL